MKDLKKRLIKMDLLEQKKEFEKIVKKYNLQDTDKAEEISKFLLSGKKISFKEFAVLFAMDEDEAKIFLSFILKGIEFKENYLDKK